MHVRNSPHHALFLGTPVTTAWEAEMRLEFTSDDLVRTRIADVPEPLAEVVFSLRMLQQPCQPPGYAQWAAATASALCAPAGSRARMLLALVPRSQPAPDYLTPLHCGDSGPDGGVDAAVDEVLRTPRPQVRAELDALVDRTGPRRGRGANWVRALAAGDRAAEAVLGDALRSYFRIAVAPHWDRAIAVMAVDRAVRTRVMAHDGIGALISGLHPTAAWRSPVLDVPSAGPGHLELAGRGLVVASSAFLRTGPVVTVIDDQPILVHPTSRTLDDVSSAADALALAVGRTRSRVLVALQDGEVTTSGLAHRLGISLPSASEHLQALRAVGWATSVRRGQTVLHALTPTGQVVLHGDG